MWPVVHTMWPVVNSMYGQRLRLVLMGMTFHPLIRTFGPPKLCGRFIVGFQVEPGRGTERKRKREGKGEERRGEKKGEKIPVVKMTQMAKVWSGLKFSL